MSISALKRRASEAHQWLFDASFPLWAQTWDPDSGLFAETLGLDHTQTDEPTTRVRVQARQVYVFTEAMRLGWNKAAAQERVEAGIATLCGAAQRSDGLIGRSLSLSTGKFVDDTADLYDAAFALMAFANAAMVLPDKAPALEGARSVLEALDLHMRDAQNGGYHEALPAPDRRLQNPHMHLFEALLCLHQIDPNGGYDKRSAEILSLFLHRFTAGEGRLLGEEFKRDWGEPEGDAAMHIEPGHQFEWVWLLHMHARQQSAPLPPEARKLYAFAVSTTNLPDGLIGRSLSLSTGKFVDDTADLYDAAFALMAFANAAMVLPDKAPALEGARSVLEALDLHMRDAQNGGYHEALPAPDRRLQNPHMHLFEALLCLHQIDPNGGHDKRSAEILSLFLHRFTAGEGRLLGEVFKRDWGEPDGDAAMLIEPGHQFEWVWLLHMHARQQSVPLPPEARKLYAFAVSTTDQQGRAMQGITRRGVVTDGSRRAWPQTESLKAHLAMLEATNDHAYSAPACATFDILIDEYLTPEGGWIDHYAEDGAILAQDMPASTGYHVVLAFAELIRIAQA